ADPSFPSGGRFVQKQHDHDQHGRHHHLAHRHSTSRLRIRFRAAAPLLSISARSPLSSSAMMPENRSTATISIMTVTRMFRMQNPSFFFIRAVTPASGTAAALPPPTDG